VFTRIHDEIFLQRVINMSGKAENSRMKYENWLVNGFKAGLNS